MPKINKPTDLNKIWAETGIAIPPSDAKYSQGWIVEAPPHETENYINKKHDTFIAHTNQHGLPQWDNVTEYQANISWTLGSNGSLYFCKTTNTNQNPVSDVAETYWRKILDGTNVLPASSVSSFALTLLDDSSASQMRSTLGGTTIGQNLFTASSSLAARVAINAENASNLTSGTLASARLANSGVSAGTYGSTSNQYPIISVDDKGRVTSANTRTIDSATESVNGIVTQATQAEVNAGSSSSKYVTPAKMRLGFDISLGTNPAYIKAPTWMGGFIWGWGSFTAAASSSGTITLTSIVPTAVRGVSINLGVGVAGDQRPPRMSPSGRNVLWQNTDGTSATCYYTFMAN